MSAISQKSISGITSITSPAGTDDQISLHTSNTNEALKIDGAGNLHLNNHVNTTGVTTASNFKTGSSNLHSTGLTVGDSFVHSTGFNVGSNIKLGTTGIITATSFVGDGSDLTNLPAGLGTALSATASSPLNKMYYTNQVLGVPSSVTVDVPASASKAYTQYADIKVDGSADLIVAEGDDLIPDILGLADFGTFGGGASAGRIRVNSISNAANDGSPTVQKGLVVTGVCTATSFSGSGANLTSLPAQATIANNADNRVITGGSGVNLNGEANLTFDGTTLTVSGNASANAVQSSFGGITTRLGFVSGSAEGVVETTSNHSLVLGVNSNEKLRIDSSGRLLLGTTTAGEADSSADDLVIGNTGSGNSGLTIVTGTGNNAAVFCADSGGTVRGGFRYQHSSDVLQFYSGGSVSLQVKSNGIGLHENYPVANSLTIRGAATDDTPLLVLKRHTDGAQSDGEIIGKIQFMSNENNVDSGNHQPRAEIHGVTVNTAGAAKLDFYTVPNSTTTPLKRMTINQVGQVTKPEQPFVMVHINTTTNRQQTGNQYIIPWDTIHGNSTNSNVGSCFNTSNHRFTAPIDGRYFFCLSMNIVADNIVYHRINGTERSKGEYRIADNVWDHVDASFIYDMNANDYYETYSQLYTSNGQRWNGGGTANGGWDTLSIYLLG